MDKKRLQQQLDQPDVPEDLEGRIRSNWKQQSSESKIRWPGYRMIALASLVGLTFVFLLTGKTSMTPTLVTAAIEDIQKDEIKGIGITVPIDSIIKINNIKKPPNSMPIKLTKYCDIDGNMTIHLKIAGSNHGKVHLFIQRDTFDSDIAGVQQGIAELMPWRLLNTQNNLSVLVLYTSDMDPASVENLIQTMFYA